MVCVLLIQGYPVWLVCYSPRGTLCGLCITHPGVPCVVGVLLIQGDPVWFVYYSSRGALCGWCYSPRGALCGLCITHPGAPCVVGVTHPGAPCVVGVLLTQGRPAHNARDMFTPRVPPLPGRDVDLHTPAPGGPSVKRQRRPEVSVRHRQVVHPVPVPLRMRCGTKNNK